MPLPIDPVLPELAAALSAKGAAALSAKGAAVLQAPAGAGKTTRVPLALLDAPWLEGRRIVMLEPRRLAARMSATWMSHTRGERPGETVGYRVRRESRVGPRTRIEVVTEGILTRMLQDDPSLERVGLVIFDEFHERSLAADLGLALTLQSREVLRPDLRVLVMSATLDGAAVARLLGDAPVITSEGRAFPVETRWLPRPAEGRIEDIVARVTLRALGEHEGDALVFLPGAGEIRRVQERLEGAVAANTRVYALHGTMTAGEQDHAVAPAPPGERKVVLATSIAETSLTIEGVRIVVDSGLARVPRFSPSIGMTRLETVRVSRAAADQRRGRAGRVAPGICWRCWTEGEDASLLAYAAPEIREADLAPLALELAVAGIRDAAELHWLDEPPTASLAQARELLRELEAVDARGMATEHGRRMASLGMHPRLAHMVLRAQDTGRAAAACDVAALLGDRDVLRGAGGPPDAALALRLAAIRGDRAEVGGAIVDRDAVSRARSEADHLRSQLAVNRAAPGDVSDAGALLALAYPDRVAQRRAGTPNRFVLRNGRGAALSHDQALTTAEFLAVALVEDRRPESRIQVAAPLSAADIESLFAAQIETEEEVAWDDALQWVTARTRRRLGAIVLSDVAARDLSPEKVAAVLRDVIIASRGAVLPWNDRTRALQQRVAFIRTIDRSWPDLSDEALLGALDEWLVPQLATLRKRSEFAALDLESLLLARLGWERRSALDRLAPTHVMVPTGSRIPVDYTEPSSPVLAVRLQEMFGLAETPTVGDGRVPLTLHLLSPAHRPVQVTRDLAGFWRSSYHDVRKDLRGRYPRHSWPEDPLTAPPTRKAKPRS